MTIFQQEVDFLIAADNEPLLLIEAKLSETQPSAALLKFQNFLQIPAVQLVRRSGGFRIYSRNNHKVLIARPGSGSPPCQGEFIIIIGDTAPLSPILFDHGLNAVSGTRV